MPKPMKPEARPAIEVHPTDAEIEANVHEGTPLEYVNDGRIEYDEQGAPQPMLARSVLELGDRVVFEEKKMTVIGIGYSEAVGYLVLLKAGARDKGEAVSARLDEIRRAR